MKTIGLLDWFRTERRSQEQTLDSSQLDTALRAALGGSAVTVRSVLNIPAVSGILLNFEFMESNEETAPEIPTADSYQISVQVNGGEIYQRSE